MADDLTIAEVAVLVALMVEARETSNLDLRDRWGVGLAGESKQRLNDRKLVASRKVGRGLAHELTELGWARVAEELDAPRPVKAVGPAGALWALLHGVGRYAGRAGIGLTDIFSQPAPGTKSPTEEQPEPHSVEAAIRAAYLNAPRLAGGGVTLAALRPLLAEIPRQAVDAALVRLGRQTRVSLLPNENQGSLTDADRAAAIRIGPVNYHYLRIEGA